MALNIIVLTLIILAALWAVLGRSLLKASIALAFTSILITIIMFRLDCHLAAVFELSICTGFITVLFISTISLTRPMSHKEIVELYKHRIKRFIYLPFLAILAGVLVSLVKIPMDFNPAPMAIETDVRNVIWNVRHLDLFGQIIILLAGAFGVVMLFKVGKKDER